jgi:oxygen-dependent protoporphyrinogen oxidase
MELDDDALIASARDEFRALLGVSASPQFVHVQRWINSMPQYAVGHRDRIAAIRNHLTVLPGFFLAGAYLDGVGIPDCVHVGESAADAAFKRVAGTASPGI